MLQLVVLSWPCFLPSLDESQSLSCQVSGVYVGNVWLTWE